MSIITYPDGSQLTSTALTDSEIQTLMQTISAQMLGIIVSPFTINITTTQNSSVCSVVNTLNLYAGELVVSAGIPENTLIIAVDNEAKTITLSNSATITGTEEATITDPNCYFKVRIGWQIEGQPGPPIDQDTVTISAVTLDTDYSRMHDIVSSESMDGTQSIQTDVYTRAWKINWTFYGPSSVDHARAIRSALVTIQFVTDFLSTSNLYVNPDIEVPKRFPENFQGRWWERVDLEVQFNEQITETFTVGTVQSVEVKMYTKDGLQSDFTVTTP
jgi:hypothetical protein